MSSQSKRISLTVDPDTYLALERLSDRHRQKISEVSLKLIHQALEAQEDLYFSKISDERLSKKQKTIPHDKAWK